jgi:cytochrome P450
MSLINSVLSTTWTRILVIAAGFAAIIQLIGISAGSLFGAEGTIKSRATAALTSLSGQRLVFSALRALLPNLLIKRKLITSYDNSGLALVTRFEDVKEVLSRDEDFEVVYGPRMIEITGGRNFFLGMQDTADYTRDVSNMRIAVRRDDIAAIVQPFAHRRATALIEVAKTGRIDVPQDLTLRVPAQLMNEYFGAPGPSEREMIEWTTIIFWYLFVDLTADAKVGGRALDAAARFRAYFDSLIQERKTHSSGADDVLNRCLAMQAGGLPGMDDIGIRDNLIGLVVGAVPTTSQAAVQALDQLLDRPDALAGAQRAAQSNDDALLARYIFEALRFNPVSKLIYRRAKTETVIARNTFRALNVPQSTMVMAAPFSAMFDRLKLKDPDSFRIDRPWNNYILWGDGLHACFAAHINPVLVPAILKPLLARRGLRRAAGAAGQIDTQGTPFPVHLFLEFDAA